MMPSQRVAVLDLLLYLLLLLVFRLLSPFAVDDFDDSVYSFVRSMVVVEADDGVISMD
jgi:hypothetical protein